MVSWSPVAASISRGELTARQLPRSWTTRSLVAARNEEAPNEAPTMTVTIGTRRPRNDG